MNIIEELAQYCDTREPTGALMLTGEWGCGKTYFIDHEFNDYIKEKAVIVRISLFGISTLEDIHKFIKREWIKKYCENKKIDKFTYVANILKDFVSKLDSIPEIVKNIASIDVTSYISIENIMDKKRVILVFDDLERCKLDYVDVLGIINEYCENQKYHTIIVANQDEMRQEPNQLTAEICFQKEDSTSDDSKNNVTLKVNKFSTTEKKELAYGEIKEKIVQRTINYIPDYSNVIKNVIKTIKYEDDEYRIFISTCEGGLISIFSSDQNGENVNDRQIKNFHNLRSLKCAVNDFYRIYKILKEHNFQKIKDWFYNFMFYMIVYKANINSKKLDIIPFELTVRELFPAFNNSYMFESIKKWILYGNWDEEKLLYEIDLRNKRDKGNKPSEIIRSSRMPHIDEDIIDAGFDEFLECVYSGELNLNEYVLFIENVAWSRTYGYTLPTSIDWNNVRKGVNKQIENIKKTLPKERLLFRAISDENKKYFNEEEWEIHKLIYDFAENGYMFFKNKKLYLDEIRANSSAGFSIVQNKRFNSFDEEMAEVTAQAFYIDDNMQKSYYADIFKGMWTTNFRDIDDVTESIKGFNKLIDLLNEHLQEYKEKNKTFSALHTKNFIKIINEIIEAINCRNS